jgi:alkylated DNA repair dioxygenase AlkB
MLKTPTSIPIEGGDLFLFENVLPPDKSAATFNQLITDVDWQKETLFLFGRHIQVPRLTAWYGDAAYTYSGVRHEPRNWVSILNALRDLVQNKTNKPFNSVLLNHYRSGSDSMSWHSDNEPELGLNPTIASLSFGGTRRFRFRNTSDKKQTLSISLSDASLLVMAGPLQHNWQHTLPKTKKIVAPRINLTFRNIKTLGSTP